MKTRGIIDLYLPGKAAFHVKIILASILIGILFPLVMGRKPWGQGTVFLILYMIFQLELFLWLGAKFFTYRTPSTVKRSITKALTRLVLFFITAFILSAATFVVYMFFVFLINGNSLDQLIPHILQMEVKGFLIGALSGYVVGSVVFFYYQWTDALKREQKLREEKLIFQYETLKSQVNPHFLFNSLNTLSSLVYRDPELSDEYIGKLSLIYRYILENVNADFIRLDQEIDFVRKYFELQQVRDDGKIELEINVTQSEGFEILPISLQLLMENAFKHNAATRENPLRMKINLDTETETVEFSNNFQPKTQMEGSNRIGLKNLAERMRLLLHRDLEINESAAFFRVMVPVKRISK